MKTILRKKSIGAHATHEVETPFLPLPKARRILSTLRGSKPAIGGLLRQTQLDSVSNAPVESLNAYCFQNLRGAKRLNHPPKAAARRDSRTSCNPQHSSFPASPRFRPSVFPHLILWPIRFFATRR